MNAWKIPPLLEKKIRSRDRSCVYCRSQFVKNSFKKRPTWEHIDNNENNISEVNIVLCCASCNASKGKKTLTAWFDTQYCKDNDISLKTVQDTVLNALNIFNRN